MVKKLRVGLIGSGYAASFHLAAVQKIAGVAVDNVGVYSATRENRERFACRFGIDPADSSEQLIERCDVVHICTPVSTHEELTLMALERDVFPIVEKPLTGYYGDGSESFRGDRFPQEKVLKEVHKRIERILEAERKSKARILYAENWVYAPTIQKEREIVEKSGAHLLWIKGEQSHSGSHAKTNSYWKYAGGGVAMGNACHPLSAALYLKRKEGLSRTGEPVRPRFVSARIHQVTQSSTFIDRGHLRSEYYDTEDYAQIHIEFEDETLADIFASALSLGGIYNRLEVAADTHRTICHINPSNAMKTFTPREDYLQDVYLVEKPGTKQGWSHPAPDEYFNTGYPQEMESFYRTAAYGESSESDSILAADSISTVYSAYLSAQQDGRKVAVKTYR